jgi:hypothetical protein
MDQTRRGNWRNECLQNDDGELKQEYEKGPSRGSVAVFRYGRMKTWLGHLDIAGLSLGVKTVEASKLPLWFTRILCHVDVTSQAMSRAIRTFPISD